MARRPASENKPSITHALKLIRSNIMPVHSAGIPFVAAPLAVALLGRRHRWIRRFGLLGAGACATFFRHPPRVPPTRPGVVVSPADGEIVAVDTAVPPPELELGNTPLPRVSIFLSVFDAHVQRAPVSGEVLSVAHQAGTFLFADLPEASTSNERNSVLIRTGEGHRIAVVQIAGLLTRRIVCQTSPGDMLAIGDTYGLICFGSRVDTYFPEGTNLVAERGQRAVGGETVFAHL